MRQRKESGSYMKIGIFIGAVVFMAVYTLSVFYVGRRTLGGVQVLFPDLRSPVFVALFGLLAGSVVVSMLPLAYPMKRVFSVLGAYYMGYYAYALPLFLLRDGLFYLGKVLKIMSSGSTGKLQSGTSLLVLVLSLGLVVYGTLHANRIYKMSYDLGMKNQNFPAETRVVLASDLHLGAVNSEGRLAELVRSINAENPDLVVFAGDLFDDDFGMIRDPQKAVDLLRGIEATHGVYASLGNHDGGKTFDKMLQFLKDSEISVLMEEHQIIGDSIVLLGRLDPSPIGGYGGLKRKETKEVLRSLPGNLPVIVLDHTPSQVEQYGPEVDLVLSGHTHQGQIFPFRWGTQLLFDVDYGYYQKSSESPVYIVTSGAGTWGPPMRVGTNSEIVSILIHRIK